MRKIIFGLFAISTLSLAQIQKPFVTIKAGLDVGGRYTPIKKEGIKFSEEKAKSAICGGEIAVELTKNVTENFEYGVGAGYQKHNTPKDKKIPAVATVSSVGFQSFPVYLTAKYFIPDIENKVYIKADLGYSFNNVTDKNITISFDDEKKISTSPIKIKNGAYYGAGLGIEVDNFIAEIMYKVNTSKLADKEKNSESKEYTYNYSRVTFLAGVKF